MGRVAIAGTSGLIGAAVARKLAGAGDILTIGRHTHCDFAADFGEPETVSKLDFAGVDTVVHCAGIVDEDFSDPGRAFRQATLGMSALVGRAKAAGVKRFVYISSAHVYGPFTGTISETSPLNPLHDYAIAHFASEQTLRRAVSDSFRGAVIRPNAVFGIPPDLARFRRWGLIPFSFPRSGVRDGLIKLASRGHNQRNFVGTDDIADVVALWLSDEAAPPFVAINPVGKANMTVFDFAERCAVIAEKVSGKRCRVERPEGAEPPPDTFRYTTSDPRYVGRTDLDATVERLMRLLTETRT